MHDCHSRTWAGVVDTVQQVFCRWSPRQFSYVCTVKRSFWLILTSTFWDTSRWAILIESFCHHLKQFPWKRIHLDLFHAFKFHLLSIDTSAVFLIIWKCGQDKALNATVNDKQGELIICRHSLLEAMNISMATGWRRYLLEKMARISLKCHFPCRWSMYTST